MKHYNKIAALAMGVCLFDVTSGLAASASTDSQAQLESAMLKITTQTEELQKEVKKLKAELRQVKQGKKINAVIAATPSSSQSVQQTATLTGAPQLLASPVINGSLPKSSFDLDPDAFLSYQGGMSQGMFYLEQRQLLAKQLQGASLPSASTPQLMLGGKLEVQGVSQSGYGHVPTTSSIDLVTAELEVLAEVSPWAMGYLEVDYNNSLLNPVLNGSGNPVNNSNIYLNRGYMTIGNLDKSPFYLSAGQMYTPFGSFSSSMLSNPVTTLLGRTNARTVQLGYDKQGFNLSAFAFDGAANTGNNSINNWGTSGAYGFSLGEFDANIGAGFINNMADAGGAQSTGGDAGTFGGFSQSASTEALVRYVPGMDINLSLARGPMYFLAEGIAATRAYDKADMSFNDAGANPRAAHLELGYAFKLLNKRSTFSLAYEETWQALAMGLPKNSYVATLNTSFWKNTVETLEFRHDVNYAATDSAGGACSYTDPVSGSVFTFCPASQVGGGQQNTVLAQIGVYF